MSVQDQASPREVAGVGLAFAGAGLYFVLGASGHAPMPDSSAPIIVILGIGLAFLFAGLICLVRAKAGAGDRDSDLPASAPLWLATSYRMLAIGLAGAMALIGGWIAIGAGPRSFSVAGPLGDMRSGGELIGRSVFALGTTILLIYAFALTVGMVRKRASGGLASGDPGEAAKPDVPTNA